MIATVAYCLLVLDGSIPWNMTWFAIALMFDGVSTLVVLSE